MRFHKDLYFPEKDKQSLYNVINGLNNLKFSFSKHCIERIQEKSDIDVVKEALKVLKFEYNNLFEYYKDYNIYKLAFRIPLNDAKDLIIVVSDYKMIITIYINNKADKHYTLNKNNYCLS